MARTKGKAAQRAFLAAFATCGQITKAAKTAGVDRGAHYDWLDADPAYPLAFQQATEQAAHALEDEAVRRAQDGVLQAEFYQGKPVGTKRVYSDGLMQFLLRGFMPHKYRQNVSAEISGPGGGPIPLEQQRLAKLTDDELAQLIAVTQKLTAPGSDAGGTGETQP